MFFTLLFIIITGFAISEKTIMKQEGDTVTLYATKTEHNFTNYLWTFGHQTPPIAIVIVTRGEVTRVNGTGFGTRLHTHVESGSITISNLTVNDSGVFMIQLNTEAGFITQTFNLSVSDNCVIQHDVLVGNNVTLESGLEELEKEHVLTWRQDGKFIANATTLAIFISESFKSVVQMNPQTGSIFLIGVTKKFMGIYSVEVWWGKDRQLLRNYQITAYECVFKPHLHIAEVNISKEPEHDDTCYIKCSVKNGDVTLYWFRGQEKINQTSDPDISNLTLPLMIQSENIGTYSCVAANPVSRETISINSTHMCPPKDKGKNTTTQIAVVVVVVVFVIVIVAVVVSVFSLYKQRNREGQNVCCHMVNLAVETQETSSQDPRAPEGRDENEEQHLLTEQT